MNIEKIRDYCISLPEVTEGFPFGEEVLVFKVLNKIFLMVNLSKNSSTINVKCDPDWAIELREQFQEIEVGYHMNKKYWNTVKTEFLPDGFVQKLILHSYEEVIKKMPKKLIKEFEVN